MLSELAAEVTTQGLLNGEITGKVTILQKRLLRGLRAEWLVDQDWESLFEQPIDQVREQLGVGPPPVYEQLRSLAAPPLAS